MYDADGWMLTDDNELIAVARDDSYKEAVRHGKTMISLLIAEITSSSSPISYQPYYVHHDPMNKKTHGPSAYESNPRKGTRKITRSSTSRNRTFKLHSREKKQHPKYIYQRLSPFMEEDMTNPVDVKPAVLENHNIISSMRIRIPMEDDNEDDDENVKDHDDQYEWQEYLWKQMQLDKYY